MNSNCNMNGNKKPKFYRKKKNQQNNNQQQQPANNNDEQKEEDFVLRVSANPQPISSLGKALTIRNVKGRYMREYFDELRRYFKRFAPITRAQVNKDFMFSLIASIFHHEYKAEYQCRTQSPIIEMLTKERMASKDHRNVLKSILFGCGEEFLSSNATIYKLYKEPITIDYYNEVISKIYPDMFVEYNYFGETYAEDVRAITGLSLCRDGWISKEICYGVLIAIVNHEMFNDLQSAIFLSNLNYLVTELSSLSLEERLLVSPLLFKLLYIISFDCKDNVRGKYHADTFRYQTKYSYIEHFNYIRISEHFSRYPRRTQLIAKSNKTNFVYYDPSEKDQAIVYSNKNLEEFLDAIYGPVKNISHIFYICARSVYENEIWFMVTDGRLVFPEYPVFRQIPLTDPTQLGSYENNKKENAVYFYGHIINTIKFRDELEEVYNMTPKCKPTVVLSVMIGDTLKYITLDNFKACNFTI